MNAASRPDLIACHDCGAVYRRPVLRPGERARCPRCGAVLHRASRLSPDQLLALVLAALILLLIANLTPIVELSVQGQSNRATLFGSIAALWSEDRQLVATLAFATTLGFPAVELSALLSVLLIWRRNPDAPPAALLLRTVQALRPWGMIEVFMLGVLVALVKLSHLAHVLPGTALWGFAALTVLLATILSFDLKTLWAARATGSGDAAFDGAAVPCHVCGLVCDTGSLHARCPRCGAALHRRKADSLTRTWALLAAAAILYLPANLLPMMETSSLFGQESDTIMSGIVYFWTSGSQDLAVLIFFVSIFVPLAKLFCLAALAVAARRGRRRGLKQSAQLFRIVEFVGRWSMLDIFVVALMVGMVRFRGLAVIEAGPGAAAFGAVVVLTILAARSFDPRLIWDASENDDEPA
jgi:paraquat-inducible protein A